MNNYGLCKIKDIDVKRTGCVEDIEGDETRGTATKTTSTTSYFERISSDFQQR